MNKEVIKKELKEYKWVNWERDNLKQDLYVFVYDFMSPSLFKGKNFVVLDQIISIVKRENLEIFYINE